MTRKLKAADPTIVAAPSSPGVYPRVEIVSTVLRMISGALDPRAMSVRLAKVGFQTATFFSTYSSSYWASLTITTLVWDVMTSMALIKNETSLIRQRITNLIQIFK